MNSATISFAGKAYRANLAVGHDLSIAMDFHGPQPNHFSAAPASAVPMQAGDFVGDTRSGGSCNAEVLTLTPHCNGTHTECIGHVTDERLTIAEVALQGLVPAALVSVVPVPAKHSKETASPAPEPADRLITGASLGKAWSALPAGDYPALIVRTLPNPVAKRHRVYTPAQDHPYFSLEAIRMLVACGVQHLLVDTPSVDRFEDRGRLAGHRVFWGMEKTGRKTPDNDRRHATITEMIYVDNDLEDGLYLLNLQVPPFMSDAAPSRPVIYALEAA